MSHMPPIMKQCAEFRKNNKFILGTAVRTYAHVGLHLKRDYTILFAETLGVFVIIPLLLTSALRNVQRKKKHALPKRQ
jgi:hypothetical protein